MGRYERLCDEADALLRICGDCDGLALDLTEADIRAQAAIHAANGEPCPEEMIRAAVRGMEAWQEDIAGRYPNEAFVNAAWEFVGEEVSRVSIVDGDERGVEIVRVQRATAYGVTGFRCVAEVEIPGRTFEDFDAVGEVVLTEAEAREQGERLAHAIQGEIGAE